MDIKYQLPAFEVYKLYFCTNVWNTCCPVVIHLTAYYLKFTCVGERHGLQRHHLLGAQVHHLVPGGQVTQRLVEVSQSQDSTLSLVQTQVPGKHQRLPRRTLWAPGHTHQQRLHPTTLQQRHLVDQWERGEPWGRGTQVSLKLVTFLGTSSLLDKHLGSAQGVMLHSSSLCSQGTDLLYIQTSK